MNLSIRHGIFLSLLISSISGIASPSVKSVPLATFMSVDKPLRLEGLRSDEELAIPMTERDLPNKARIHLELTSSSALISGRSQMNVQFNGWHVAQLPLDGNNPKLKADIPIPPEYFKPGYNTVRFSGVQHYSREACENGGAPELWSEIDSIKSYVQIELSPRKLTPSLSLIKKTWTETQRDYHLGIVSLDKEQGTQSLERAARVAQAAGLGLKYAPLTIKAENSNDLIPGRSSMDRVIIGTKAELSSILPQDIQPHIQGPYLRVDPQNGDEEHFQLIVSGVSDDDVTAASRALARLFDQLPDVRELQISPDGVSPGASPTLAIGSINKSGAYSFASLGTQSVTLMPFASSARGLEFQLPGDFMASDSSTVDLWLHMNYRSGLSKESVMNLIVNGTYAKSISLNDVNGGEFNSYHIAIPVSLIRPGKNQIRFAADLKLATPGGCEPSVGLDSRYLSLFDDSIIEIPTFSHLARVPDLSLFLNTGYPLLSPGTNPKPQIRLLDQDQDTLSAALQMTALLAQIQGRTLEELSIGYGPNESQSHTLYIGKMNSLGDIDTLEAPFRPGVHQHFRLDSPSAVSVISPEWSERIKQWLLGIDKPALTKHLRSDVPIEWDGDLHHQKLLMSYLSNKDKSQIDFVLTAETGALLEEAARNLQTPEFRYKMTGGMAIWAETPESILSQPPMDTVMIGDAGYRQRLAVFLSTAPLSTLALIIFNAGLVSYFVYRLVRTRMLQKQHSVKALEH